MEFKAIGSLLLQLGVGGAFAVIILIVVFGFLKKWLNRTVPEVIIKGNNKKNSRQNQPRCVNIPEVREAIKNNILTAKAVDNLTGHMETVKTEALVQTAVLKGIKEVLDNKLDNIDQKLDKL